MSQILCSGLSLGYDGRTIVQNINFSVESGNYLCILGENGSGKSTLVNTLLGLCPPTGGSIRFGDGIKQTDIGYLPQQTVVQKDFPASVREIVLSGCQGKCAFRPFYSAAEKKTADDAMEKMSISGLKNRCYRELSGGQKQRVLLARALCAANKLLLLDEPVAGLDPKVTAEMYSLISELNRKDGVTIIMISHDIPSALCYATHILHIDKNSVFFGTKEEYVNTPVGKAFTGGAEQ